MDARIDRVVPDGQDGCNTWLVGDDTEVIVVDPGDNAEAVLAAASGREILAVICTHGHQGHVAAALEVAARDGAPVALHPRDLLVWREAHAGQDPEIQMEEGGVFEVADAAPPGSHPPAHDPAAVSRYFEELGPAPDGAAPPPAGPTWLVVSYQSARTGATAGATAVQVKLTGSSVTTTAAERVQVYLVPTGTGTALRARLIADAAPAAGTFAFTWDYPDEPVPAHHTHVCEAAHECA